MSASLALEPGAPLALEPGAASGGGPGAAAPQDAAAVAVEIDILAFALVVEAADLGSEAECIACLAAVRRSAAPAFVDAHLTSIIDGARRLRAETDTPLAMMRDSIPARPGPALPGPARPGPARLGPARPGPIGLGLGLALAAAALWPLPAAAARAVAGAPVYVATLQGVYLVGLTCLACGLVIGAAAAQPLAGRGRDQ